MRKPLIAATLGMLLLADLAHAQTLVATSNIIVRAFGRSIDFTSDTTTSIRDSKVVREAHDDAASFVASNGDIRGVQPRPPSAPCASVCQKPAVPAIRYWLKPSSRCEPPTCLAARLRPDAARHTRIGRPAA